MRTIWALVVVCLVAATGVAPASAAGTVRSDARAQLTDPRPALPAVTGAHGASLVVAIRARSVPTQLPPALLGARPAAPGLTVRAIAATVCRIPTHAAAPLPIRSARGPPAR